MNQKLFTFLFLFLFLTKAYASSLDLEEAYLQPFVKNTTRIEIPDFPYAFNPSIVPWKGFYILSFRAGKGYEHQEDEPQQIDCFVDQNYCLSRQAPSHSPNRIGLLLLDKEFNIVSKPQLLDVPNDNPTYRQQDPRLISVGGKIYILYSDVIKGVWVEETRRMKTAELCFENGLFSVKNVECLSEFEDIKDQRWEKNWVPFNYENNLLLAYSINPHKIFFPLLGSGVCATVASTHGIIEWKWGELRGGTPAILVDGEYLAFFHSSTAIETKQSKGKKGQHYFMGAYTFSAHPPFRVTRISPMPIVGENFYNGNEYVTWKPNLQVVFPGGIVADKNDIYVAYGRQDHEIWIAQLDKNGLYQSLVSVTPQNEKNL